jgi:hypothetical protein
MAQTPMCELHAGEHEAAYIIGMVDTGEQLYLCNEGAAHFGLTLALQVLDPAEIANAAQALLAAPANGETGDKPANRPARKSATKPASKSRAKPQPGLSKESPAADNSGTGGLE